MQTAPERFWLLRLLGCSAIAVICTLLARPALAADSSKPGPNDLIFEFAKLKLPQGAQIQVIHGVAVRLRLRDWPAVVLAEVNNTDAPICTSSMVGPGVLLLAAHCFEDVPNSWLRAGNATVHLDCAHTSAREDLALCYADITNIAPFMPHLAYEQLDTAPVSATTQVLMMGFGCTDIDDTAVRGDVLRVGDTAVTTAATADVPYAKIVANTTQPALCPGDSGGPLLTGVTTVLQTLPRRIRGVNESVVPTGPTLTSSVSMLSDSKFLPWAKDWLMKHPGAYICGLDPVPVKNACRP